MQQYAKKKNYGLAYGGGSQLRMVKRGLKSRYQNTTSKGKQSYDIGKIITDVGNIKRSLNVEHKHYDFMIGSQFPIKEQKPMDIIPIVLPISLPTRGTSYNNRIGNQIKVTHITSKFEFEFQNNNDLENSRTASVQLLWAKDASNVPTIEELYEQDANGKYTPLSMANTQEWNKFKWEKGHSHYVKNVQLTNRYPGSNSAGALDNPNSAASTAQINAYDNATQNLQKVIEYSSKQTMADLRVSFENNTENVTLMKPYLLFRSNCTSTSSATVDRRDPVNISGIVRITYVDN